MPLNGASSFDETVLRELLVGRPCSAAAAEPELAKAHAAYQKLEGLFELLRRPAFPGANDRPRLRPGMRLAEFTLLRNLGEGGMGTVFLALQESLRRYVAVKVCQPEFSDDPRFRDRFQAEAQVLARMRHPFIVPVYASGIEQGHLFLAMEYLDGPTLADVLDALRWWPGEATASEIVAAVLNGCAIPDPVHSPLRRVTMDAAYVGWVVGTSYKIALALAVTHSNGLIHLDMKPSNIIFDSGGEPKLVDFGLAIADPERQTAISRKGFFGTPEYASPEQLRGDVQDCSASSDVYSFGVTLYECLSLRRPFAGSNFAELADSAIKQPPAPLRSLNRRIRWELDAIVSTCLEKQPSRRYRNGAHLGQDLLNFVEARPLATKSTVVRRLRYWAKIHPLGAGVCAFLVLLLLLVAVAAVLEPAKAEKGRVSQQYVDSGDANFLFDSIARYCGATASDSEVFWRQALLDYSAAVESRPDSIWLRTQRGILQLESGEAIAEALNDLTRVADMKPKFASVHKLLAIARARLGEKELAERELQMARQIYPTAAEDLYWLGYIAFYIEREPKAADAFWANCLLVEPESYSGRVQPRTAQSPAFNLHVLARIQRALCTNYHGRNVENELRLAAELSPTFAEACEIPQLAKMLERSTPDKADD